MYRELRAECQGGRGGGLGVVALLGQPKQFFATLQGENRKQCFQQLAFGLWRSLKIGQPLTTFHCIYLWPHTHRERERERERERPPLFVCHVARFAGTGGLRHSAIRPNHLAA
jgi:hypothetical protein